MNSAEKLEKIFKENEYIEVNDILETTSFYEDDIKKLIAENIKWGIQRDLKKKTVKKIRIVEWETHEPTRQSLPVILGVYEVFFKDGSDYNGKFLADVAFFGQEMELTNLTFGGPALRYFGP
jgi:hypothetical protein